jgi:hypothetical protein
VASQVNQNFTDLVTFLNNSVVHRDGSVALTAALSLAAADPTANDHAARKSYVDNKAATATLSAFPIGATLLWPLSSAPAPSGGITYLECDGTAVSRTTYATLFALKSGAAPFGPGNGTTTFDLPNLTSLAPSGHCFIVRAL